jgi:hypothetical protein
MKATSADYYAQDALNEHMCGDVWWEMPTFGLLPLSTSIAIVITPACDLDNCKTETLTYLPCIPVQTYFSTPPIARRVKGELRQLLGSKYLSEFIPPLLNDDTLALSNYEAAQLSTLLASHGEALGESKVKRITDGLALLKCITAGSLPDGMALFKSVFGKTGGRIIDEIVRNNRPDTHFLPKDLQPAEYGVMPAHSVILFRYPVTVPMEIVEGIDYDADSAWKTAFRGRDFLTESLAMFGEKPPIKRGRVREPFMKDIITRYVASFGRLGSPDFSTQLASDICMEIEAS